MYQNLQIQKLYFLINCLSSHFDSGNRINVLGSQTNESSRINGKIFWLPETHNTLEKFEISQICIFQTVFLADYT